MLAPGVLAAGVLVSGLPGNAVASPAALSAEAVSRISPGSADNPSNVRRVESIVGAGQFAGFFPLRATAYSYGNFLKAIGKYPDVCGDRASEPDALLACRRTLATLFAHFAHETNAGEAWRLLPAWQQGLAAMRETGWDETRTDGYNSNCADGSEAALRYPCAVFPGGGYKSYFGRGAFQLSWNFNYGALSESIYGTPRTLLEHPELVAESWLNFASATFFFTHSTNGRPSMQQVLDGTWTPSAADMAAGRVPGFGMTTWLINGALECGKGVESQQSGKRIEYYRAFARALSVPVPADEMLGCRDMQLPK